MRILTRYVLIEFCKVFFTALTSLTLLMLIVGLGKEAADEGLGPAQALRLIPYILPDSLRFTLPATTLFAISMIYGRMSAANEIVAIKSLGISPLALLSPVLILAFLISLVAVWLNDLGVSWGRLGVERVVLAAAEEIAYGMLRTHHAYSTKQFSINVKRVDGRRLIQPHISFRSGKDRPAFTLTAEEAELRIEPSANKLTFLCRNATMDYGDKVTMRQPRTFEHVIPLSDRQTSATETHPSFMALRAIPGAIEKQDQEILELEQEYAAHAAYQMLSGDLEGLQDKDWSRAANTLEAAWSHLHRLQTEPYRRWANGFSCLCFALVGAAMAIRWRNADLLTSFFLCFLPILVVYYPLLMYGVDAAKNGRLPPTIVWLGNLILVVWGLWMMRRVIRN